METTSFSLKHNKCDEQQEIERKEKPTDIQSQMKE